MKIYPFSFQEKGVGMSSWILLNKGFYPKPLQQQGDDSLVRTSPLAPSPVRRGEQYLAIIDCYENLPLLFSREGGGDEFPNAEHQRTNNIIEFFLF
jgi:hypothetical protein